MNLSLADYASLSPLIILLIGALALLVMESISRTWAKHYAATFSFVTIAIALYAAYHAPASTNPLITPWVRFDSVAHFFTLLFLAIGLGATLLATSFFQRFDASRSEYYFFLLSSLFGLVLIGVSADFLMLFIGLETLSISLYVLCGYMKMWKISHEAAIKYFLMGSLAAALLLYGIALIYGAVGTTRFDALLNGYHNMKTSSEHILFMSGISLVTIGLAFKATIVPFHVWSPDVYEGAPTPVTAFMAVGTKAGAYAAFVILFFVSLPQFNPLWNQIIAWLALPTLIYGNFVAMRQNHLRRFFAYSGISHAGFLLLPLAADTPDALSALLFYLVVYAFGTLGCFAVLAFLDQRSEGAVYNDLRGLMRRSPFLAATLAVCLLTLAGIPPTVGFFAKFFLIKVAFEAGFYTLVIVALLTTILSAYYYLRIIAFMLTDAPAEDKAFHRSWPPAVVGALSFAAILVASFYPEPLYTLISLVKK